MIDYLFKFASEANAKIDPVTGAYWRDDGQGYGTWDGSCCIPGVLVWQPSTDTTSTITAPDGQIVTIVAHHPIVDAGGNPYWYILISKPEQDAALTAHAGMVLVTDRDKANARQPFVLSSPLTTTALATYMLQPSFAGSNYPFGAPQ